MPAVAKKAQEPDTIINQLEGEMIDGKWQGKWVIHDPRTVRYAERTDFLKSICGHIDHEETLEDVLLANPANAVHRGTPRFDLYQMAQQYYTLRNKGARLPKFSRWVTGMFSGNKEFAKILADEGQKAARRKIIMSVDLVDILRNAATPHFQSCFNLGGAYKEYTNMPKRIAEECPGIGIIYVDDENGFMMGRHWMHHAKIADTGEDMIVLTQSRYGCLEGANVARLLADRGIKVGMGSYYGEEVSGSNAVRVQYQGCFTRSVHHDLTTWVAAPKVRIVPPAFTK